MRSVLKTHTIGCRKKRHLQTSPESHCQLARRRSLCLSTSATLFPPSCLPAMHKEWHREQISKNVSITPPILSTTTTSFQKAWKASDTAFNMFCSSLVRLKSATIRSKVRKYVPASPVPHRPCSLLADDLCGKHLSRTGTSMNHSFLSLTDVLRFSGKLHSYSSALHPPHSRHSSSRPIAENSTKRGSRCPDLYRLQ